MKKNRAKIVGTTAGAVARLLLGGFLALGFGSVALIGMVENTMETFMLVLSLVAAAVGLLLLLTGIRRFLLVRKVSAYAAFLDEQEERSVEDMAATLGVSAKKVRKTVQKLMEKKYLTNVVYDGSADRFMAADHVERKAVREEKEAELDFDAIDTKSGEN